MFLARSSSSYSDEDRAGASTWHRREISHSLSLALVRKLTTLTHILEGRVHDDEKLRLSRFIETGDGGAEVCFTWVARLCAALV